MRSIATKRSARRITDKAPPYARGFDGASPRARVRKCSRAQASGISWAVIRAPEENYDLPHYQQRNFWRAVEQPEIGRAIPYPRGPFMAEELQIEPRRRAPHL